MKHFTIEELTRSTTAERFGIDNTPSAEVIRNLERLTDELLDPIRERWGKPIRVTSGYRCPQLNSVVRGAAHSHHMEGLAADLIGGTPRENYALYQLIRQSGIPYGELIAEYQRAKDSCLWVHVSAAAPRLGVRG